MQDMRSPDGEMTKSEARNPKECRMSECRIEESWEESSVTLREDEPVRTYDLEERSAKFGENVIRLLRTVPQNALTNRIINQLVGCATAVGANYCEADDGLSPRDFRKFIGICRKESKECNHFLRMLATDVPERAPDCRTLYREARELNLIFSSIWRRTTPDK
jgi:four helix bundle protein